MTNFSRAIMTAAVAVSFLAALQLSASAQGGAARTLSMSGGHANVVMASDRDDRWRGDRDDRGYDRDRDRHRHHDNDDAWLIGGALLGLYLLTR